MYAYTSNNPVMRIDPNGYRYVENEPSISSSSKKTAYDYFNEYNSNYFGVYWSGATLDGGINGVNGIFYGAGREVGDDIALTLTSKFFGNLFSVLGLGVQIGAANKHYSTIDDPAIRNEAMQLEVGNIAVGYAGAWGGAKVGMSIGFALGGPVGAVVGGIVGGAAGYFIADKAYDWGVKRLYGR